MAELLDYLSSKYGIRDVQRINERLLELSSIIEISQILNATLELNSILNQLLLIPMGRLMIGRGVIFLKRNNRFRPEHAKGLRLPEPSPEFSARQLPQEPIFHHADESSGKTNDVFAEFCRKFKLPIYIPLKAQDQLLGALFFGDKLNGKIFSPEERNFLTSLANIAATAIANALKVEEIRAINRELDQRIQQLKTLFDINQGLTATFDITKIKKLLSYAIMGQMVVNQIALIIFPDQFSGGIDAVGFRQEAMESLVEALHQLESHTTALMTEELPYPELRERLIRLNVRVIIPLRSQNQMMGAVLLGPKINQQPYSAADLEFLSTLVNQATISLENARLFQETLEKQRIEQELQVARNIQQMLLPHTIPDIPGYQVWGINLPSREVGGDYFDIIPLNEQEVAIAIGDVSGKSVPAALLMANLQAGLRTLITTGIPLPELVGKLNHLIHQNTDLDKYITFFLGILNRETHRFQYVNAGHNPPLLLRADGTTEQLTTGGLILGMMPDFPYEMGNVRFEPDDFLFCYTDGVNESLNNQEEEFGEERLHTFLTTHRHLPVQQIAHQLVEALQTFSQGVPQFDDITMILLKRKQQ